MTNQKAICKAADYLSSKGSPIAVITGGKNEWAFFCQKTKAVFYCTQNVSEYHRCRMPSVQHKNAFCPDVGTRLLVDIEGDSNKLLVAEEQAIHAIIAYSLLPNLAGVYVFVTSQQMKKLGHSLGQVTVYQLDKKHLLVEKRTRGMEITTRLLPKSLPCAQRNTQNCLRQESNAEYDPSDSLIGISISRVEPSGVIQHVKEISLMNQTFLSPGSNRYSVMGHAIAVALVDAVSATRWRASETYIEDAVVLFGRRVLGDEPARIVETSKCLAAGFQTLGALEAGLRHNLLAMSLTLKQAGQLAGELLQPLPPRGISIVQTLLFCLSAISTELPLKLLLKTETTTACVNAYIGLPDQAIHALKSLGFDQIPCQCALVRASGAFLEQAVQYAALELILLLGGEEAIKTYLQAIDEIIFRAYPKERITLSNLPHLMCDTIGFIIWRSNYDDRAFFLYQVSVYASEPICSGCHNNAAEFLHSVIHW